jgi:hypothetical protein
LFINGYPKSPSEEEVGLLLSPIMGIARNQFGIYSPNPAFYKEQLFQPGLRAQKKTHAKKVIVERNLKFLQNETGIIPKVLENELSLPIISFFIMIKCFLSIALQEKVPIRLQIRVFRGNIENLKYTDVVLDYVV